MRMEFKIIFDCEDSFKKKLEKEISENKDFHFQMLSAFSNIVMVSLKLDEEDKAMIVGFRAGEVPDPKPVTKEEKDQFKKDLENKFFFSEEKS